MIKEEAEIKLFSKSDNGSSFAMIKSKKLKEMSGTYLRVISDSPFHGSTSIVMLNPKSDVRHQSSVVLRYRALHLNHSQNPNQLRRIPKTKRINPRKKKNSQTLISLNGIIRLFSIFESNPRIRDAWRKFLFVAAKAFMSQLSSEENQQSSQVIGRSKI